MATNWLASRRGRAYRAVDGAVKTRSADGRPKSTLTKSLARTMTLRGGSPVAFLFETEEAVVAVCIIRNHRFDLGFITV